MPDAQVGSADETGAQQRRHLLGQRADLDHAGCNRRLPGVGEKLRRQVGCLYARVLDVAKVVVQGAIRWRVFERKLDVAEDPGQ